MSITTRQELPAGTAGFRSAGGGWAWPTPWIEPPSSPVTRLEVAQAGNQRAGSPPVDHVTGSPDRPIIATLPTSGPSALLRLHVEQRQSPWLDHLTRETLEDGTLSRLVAAGIRGVTANPAILARALEVSPAYREQLSWLLSTGCAVEEAYRELAATDVIAACAVLRPVYDTSQASDGFVSIEVAPSLALSAPGAMAATRRLHQRIDRSNLVVAIPATPSGVQAVQAMFAAGRNINATSIFSIDRYSAVIDAYLGGLEEFTAHGGDPATVHGVASFSLGPVDEEVDKRLARLGSSRTFGLRGLAAVAQAKLAYRLFEERFSTERWARLAARGAQPQRLLWASAETHRTADDASRYVQELIGPHTVQTLSRPTVAALMESGTVDRNLDLGIREAARVLSDLAALGIDLEDVGVMLENKRAERTQLALAGVLDRLPATRGKP